jgi:hypothetical protein
MAAEVPICCAGYEVTVHKLTSDGDVMEEGSEGKGEGDWGLRACAARAREDAGGCTD